MPRRAAGQVTFPDGRPATLLASALLASALLTGEALRAAGSNGRAMCVCARVRVYVRAGRACARARVFVCGGGGGVRV